MIRARSTRLVGSVRDREISCKRCRCSASVGSAITRRGATTGSPNPIPPPRLLPHLAQHAKSNPNILIFWNLCTRTQLDNEIETAVQRETFKQMLLRLQDDPQIQQKIGTFLRGSGLARSTGINVPQRWHR